MREPIDGLFQCLRCRYADPQQECILAGDEVAFVDFGHLASDRNYAGNEVADDTDANECADREAHLVAVDFYPVAGDDVGFFHSAHALDYGWVGEPDATPKFDKLNSGVVL